MQFVSLSYHYIREPENTGPFSRIIGISKKEFENQVDTLLRTYEPLSEKDIVQFYKERIVPPQIKKSGKKGILFTFDDGLSDHVDVSHVLDDRGIKGIFFTPTCIFADKEPANPQIIHYALSIAGIETFLETYNSLLSKHSIQKTLELYFKKGVDDVWKTIATIKKKFKYDIPHTIGRALLLDIYNECILSQFKDALSLIHLNEEQVQNIYKRGHSIGVHSHTHLSVKASSLNDQELERELIAPKKILEKITNDPIDTMSYPFGRKQDCLSGRQLAGFTDAYTLAFTTEEVANSERSEPLELGRYMPQSKDTAEDILSKLKEMEQGV